MLKMEIMTKEVTEEISFGLSITEDVETDIAMIICDICQCKQVYDSPYAWDDDNGKGVADTKLYIEECVSDWPPDSEGTKTNYDICPDCFRNKLMPWLKEQGATPTEINCPVKKENKQWL